MRFSQEVDFEAYIDEGDKKPFVTCASRNKWLVLAIGCDLHFFNLTVGNRVDRRKIITLKDVVVAIKFLPDCDVLFLVMANGEVALCLPPTKSTLDESEFLTSKQFFPPFVKSCSVCIADEIDCYTICILQKNDSAHFLELKKPIGGILSEETLNAFKWTFSSEKMNCDHVARSGNSFVYFPSHKGSMVKATNIFEVNCTRSFDDFFEMENSILMVRNVGCFVVVLTSNNQLCFYDMNLILLHKHLLGFANSANQKVIDFEFLDVADFTEIAVETRIMFQLKTEVGIEITIRSLNNSSELFSATASTFQNILVSNSTFNDGKNFIYVDLFPESKPSAIYLRFISEALPSLRLNRLLDSGLYEEALEFAKNAGLSLDIVYIALVRKYQHEILVKVQDYINLDLKGRQELPLSEYDSVLFDNMMKYLELLSDHNEACDFCVGSLNAVNKYEHIERLLNFAQRKPITDETTESQILRIRYELATYRMLFGGSFARFDQYSEWCSFILNVSHTEYFDRFCEQGQITEARILFSRYPVEISQHLNVPTLQIGVEKLLNLFEKCIQKSSVKHEPVSEFIEMDLIPLLASNPVDINANLGEAIFTFLIKIAENLEQIEPGNFPENSLNFARTFDRGITQVMADCRTSDQHVGLLYMLKLLDIDSIDEKSTIGRLNRMIRNLKTLVKIHRTYQCPISYSEYLTHDINSICYRILDRVRTAQSVREHIERFVFAYMSEYKLDKNLMLQQYIKQLADVYYRGNSQYSNSWDLMCLQIVNSITEADIKCKAIIEIASGSIPPWSTQLTNAVKTVLAWEKVDPKLIEQLKIECLRADLGQLFIAYQIPLNARSSIMDASSLKSLLRFLFRNNERESNVKLNDAFKIVTICEQLKGELISRIECYYLYATVIIQQLNDEYNLKPLMDFFHLIKLPEESTEVAWKLVFYLKAFLKPNKIRKVNERRLIWISCLLCVLERYLRKTPEIDRLIFQTRNIRTLQTVYDIYVDFETFQHGGHSASLTCLNLLKEFITTKVSEKSLIQVVSFGTLCCLNLRDICNLLIKLQIENELVEPAMTSLEFYLEQQSELSLEDLELGYFTFKSTLFKMTDAAITNHFVELKPLNRIVNLFRKGTLPILIDGAARLENTFYLEAFCRISRYIAILHHLLCQCVSTEQDDGMDVDMAGDVGMANSKANNEEALIFTTCRRVGAYLPSHEGTFMEMSTGAIRTACIVASSIAERLLDEENRIKLDHEMYEYWNKLFVQLEAQHTLLQVHARIFAYSLPCFNGLSNGVDNEQISNKNPITELAKKVLNVSVADIQLVAHLLLTLPDMEMKETLNVLRRWVATRKNIRVTLNLIRVSLFVLLMRKDTVYTSQISIWFENTLWHKKLSKLGMSIGNPAQLRKNENMLELLAESVKVLAPADILCQISLDMRIDGNELLLKYAIELLKGSVNLTGEKKRFQLCIETARMAFQYVQLSRESVDELIGLIPLLSPYNYEAIDLALKQLKTWMEEDKSENAQHNIFDEERIYWVKDRLVLLNFLRYFKRENGFTKAEMRWFRNWTNNKSMQLDNTTLLSTSLIRNASGDDNTTLLNESVPTSFSGIIGQLYRKQEVYDINIAPSFMDRLPFHVFVNEEESFFKSTLMPIIANEITIYNITRWSNLLSDTKKILKQSRTMLLVNTINRLVDDASSYKRDLQACDFNQMHRLIFDSHTRFTLLQALANHFGKLPLSQLKICLFQMSCEVAEAWLKMPDLDSREMEEIQTYRDALDVNLAHISTNYLLSKNGLLNGETQEISNDAPELISYICSNYIEWNDPDQIDYHFGIIEQIAHINRVDLNVVYDDLMHSWLPGSEHLSHAPRSDPDATIDFTSNYSAPMTVGGRVGSPNSIDDDELVIPIMYNDPQLIRIVHLLRKCDADTDKARILAQKFEQDVSIVAGGYNTKLRIACCLIRFLSEEQFQTLFRLDFSAFCDHLVHLLNQRLLSICRVDMPMVEFDSCPKDEFVRSIISRRQTPEIAHLVVCLIVDNQIDDPNLIAKASQQLLQQRMIKPLLGLLRFARRICSEIQTIPNIATYYARLFEWMFDKMDFSDSQNDVITPEIIDLIYFLLGCPVEGGSSFGRVKTILTNYKAYQASNLIAIAALPTAVLPNITPGACSKFDLKLYQEN